MKISARPAGKHRRRQRRIWRTGWLAGMFALSAVLAGADDTSSNGVGRHEYRPDNVFAYPAKLSLDLRRVAVLPLTIGAAGNDLPEGCDALGPVLVEQLIKTKRFEVITVDPIALRRSTGRTSWTGGDTLPADFFATLRHTYGCDAVLFAELTSYRAYAPLAVGWRLKLVDARSSQIIWATDELFDAAQPAVYRAAQRFAGERIALPFWHEENWLAANSPRQFGRYSAAALLEKLPER
jgi:hypothetical protein